jgi:hypothetical protein
VSKFKTDNLLQEGTLRSAAGEDEGTPEGEEFCESRWVNCFRAVCQNGG